MGSCGRTSPEPELPALAVLPRCSSRAEVLLVHRSRMSWGADCARPVQWLWIVLRHERAHRSPPPRNSTTTAAVARRRRAGDGRHTIWVRAIWQPAHRASEAHGAYRSHGYDLRPVNRRKPKATARFRLRLSARCSFETKAKSSSGGRGSRVPLSARRRRFVSRLSRDRRSCSGTRNRATPASDRCRRGVR